MRPALIAMLLVSPAAHATWRSATVAGTARDVTAVDAGAAVVATAGGPGAFILWSPPDGGAPVQGQTMAGSYVTATLRGPCLVGYTGNFAPASNVIFDGVCAGNSPIHTGGGRLRAAGNGAVYLNTINVGPHFISRLDPGAAPNAANFASLVTGSTAGPPFYPLSAATMASGEWAATELTNGLTLYRNSVLVTQVQLAPKGIRDLTLFDRNDRPGLVIATDGGQLLYSDDGSDGGTVVLNVPVLPYSSVTFTDLGGSAYGRGFGMATAGTQVWSPVPNPNQVGLQWVQRSGAPATLVRASCADPTYCAAIAGVGTPNVFAYTNDNAPAAELKIANVTAGSTAAYVLDAGDLDGDPIWVTWIDGGFVLDGGSNPFAIGVVGPPGTCAGPPTVPPLIAVLSDGYAPHDRVVAINVLVAAGTASTPALTAAPPALTQTAGGPTDPIVAGYPADSGCAVPTLTWTISPADGGPTLSTSLGNFVDVTPPAVFCNATPQVFTVTGTGAPDASVSVPVTLGPWGRPNVPAFAGGVVQPAGSAQIHQPLALSSHLCAMANNFPGTELVWTRVDAGAEASLAVTPSTTGLAIASSDACRGGAVEGFARWQVTGLPAQASVDAGRLFVTIVPNWSPITGATSFDAGFAYDSAMSRLTGDFSIGTNCAADRGLGARVTVDRVGGGTVGTRDGIAVPGTWFVDVPGGCSGGDFRAQATLIDDAGQPYGPQATYDFSAARLPAHVPALSVTEVPVSCAQGARGTLSLALDPNDCAAQRFTWTGAAITAIADGGAQATFATPAGDLQSQAGQDLVVTVTAAIDSTNTDTQVRRVRLVPERFIEVTHRSDVPVAREEEAVGVEVTLANPTACAVSGVTLREALGGLKPVANSVRVDGAEADAAFTGDLLEVRGLAIPAGGAAKVRYLARVPILSAARPFGTATFAGTDVTVLSGLPPPATGCGCNSSPAEWTLTLLALVLVRARRRSG